MKATDDPVVRVARVVAPALAIGFAVVVALGLAAGTFASEGEELLALGWGRITLLDTYLAFALGIAWVFVRETTGRAVALAVGILVLGSIVIWGWVAVVAWQSSDRRELLLGTTP